MAKRTLTVKEKTRRLVYGLKKRGANARECRSARRFILAWFERGQDVCHYCRKSLPLREVSLDHAQPVSRQGGHRRENLRLCCKRCNLAKGNLDEAEFAGLLGFIAAWPEASQNSILRRLVAAGNVFRRRGR